MKRFVSFIAAGMIAGTFAGQGLALAQNNNSSNASGPPVVVTSAGAPLSDLDVQRYKAFDEFKEDHPEIAHALANNPRLIDSQRFQRSHPALRDFLSNNPDFTTAFLENPGDFIVPAATHRAHRNYHAKNMPAASGEGANANTGAASPGEGGNAGAAMNAGGGANTGGTNAGAGANAAGGGAPNGVPAAEGGAGATSGNTGAGAGSAPSSPSGSNM